MTRPALLLLLLLASCGSADDAADNASTRRKAPALPPQLVPSTDPDSLAAAEALKAYYQAIARRDFRAAWAMRAAGSGRSRVTYEDFAANYARYARYDAQVAYASPPARNAEAMFVTVQVQLTGTMQDGSPFGTVGTITMRRKLSGSAAERQWKVTS